MRGNSKFKFKSYIRNCQVMWGALTLHHNKKLPKQRQCLVDNVHDFQLFSSLRSVLSLPCDSAASYGCESTSSITSEFWSVSTSTGVGLM